MALKAMRELPDYVMAPGSPDVEGWQVHDRDGQVVGTVIDLVVDTATDLVRYLVVQLCDGKHVLMAMGDLDLDEDRGVIRLVTHTRADLEALPAYTPPTLTTELEERYYILFRREEPVGASDMSPLDYRIPPFRARGDRADSLMRSPRRVTGERAEAATPPEPAAERLLARREPTEPEAAAPTGERMLARREPEGRRGVVGQPVKGLPGPGVGIFAANEPWDIADLSADKAGRRPGEMDHLGPDAEKEALWQSEQPGFTSALGAKRELPEEGKRD